MRFLILISVFQLVASSVIAQIDPQAIKILDSFSSKATGAPSVSMNFLMITTDQLEDTKDTTEGSVIISRNKYRLDLPDNIVWYNGQTSWSYLPVEKEVTIINPDKKDKSFQTNPSSIFTMYKEGFKSRLIEEKADIYIIDLYPEDIQSDDLVRVRLSIEKQSLNLLKFEYKRRDGITIDFIIKDYDLSFNPVHDTFVFSSAEYKDAEIIDMR